MAFGIKMNLKVIFILVAFLFFVGCEAPKPPPAPIAPAKPEAKAPKAEAEVKKEDEKPYSYTPAGKVDPFKPFIELTPPAPAGVRAPGVAPVKPAAPAIPAKPRPKRPTPAPTPLQRFDLAQLKLVGVIAQPEGNLALIEDPTGRGYIVSVGTAIGLKSGIVKKITTEGVVVEEEEQKPTGEVGYPEVTMALGKAPERK